MTGRGGRCTCFHRSPCSTIQKLQATQDGKIILIAPWWPSQPRIPRLLCLCYVGTSLASSHTAETYCHNRGFSRTIFVPSARMEALRQQYQAAGFSEEVSRLAAAPKRPSTNRIYSDLARLLSLVRRTRKRN